MKKKISIDIYRSSVTLIIGESVDDLIEEHGIDKKHDLPKRSFAEDDAVTIDIGYREFYIILSNRALTPGTISHEANHVVNRVFNDIGYTVVPDNDECQSYFIDWLVDRIWNIAEKYKENTNATLGN